MRYKIFCAVLTLALIGSFAIPTWSKGEPIKESIWTKQLILANSNDNPVASFQIEKDGAPSFGMFRDGKLRVFVGFDTQGAPMISLYDKEGTERFFALVSNSGGSGYGVKNRDGKVIPGQVSQ